MHISHTKSFNISVSISLATLAHMINVYEICLNKQTIWYSTCKISDIAWGPPFWTVLVSWYPHHGVEEFWRIISKTVYNPTCCVTMICTLLLCGFLLYFLVDGLKDNCKQYSDNQKILCKSMLSFSGFHIHICLPPLLIKTKRVIPKLIKHLKSLRSKRCLPVMI